MKIPIDGECVVVDPVKVVKIQLITTVKKCLFFSIKLLLTL